MRGVRLFWHLYPFYLLITVICLLVAGWFVAVTLKNFHDEQVAADLEARARLLSDRIAAMFESGEADRLDAFCKDMGARIGTRITVILPSGEVAGDSHKAPALMDNHADRPEVRAALATGLGSSVRHSRTLGTDMMYVAVPVASGGRTLAVVRASMPLTAIDSALADFWKKVAWGGAAAAFLAALLCFFASRRISRPLEEITAEVQQIAEGTQGRGLVLRGSPSREFAILAEAIERMTAELERRMRAVEAHRRELEAVLSGMEEGVLAVDGGGRLITLNSSAARMLGLDAGRACGRGYAETLRNAALLELVRSVAETGETREEELTLDDDGKRIVQARAVPLRRDEAGSGVLVVLNDVTRLREVDRIRKDFVANVSHELKTPITAVKGFAETLLDGALQDPAAAERFLAIIADHADRMGKIVEDLLTLSRLEQDSGGEEPAFERLRAAEVARSAAEACSVAAGAAGVSIELDVPDGLAVRANPLLLEQALVNLIDNAVKYSGPGGSVRVRGGRAGGEVVLSVEDDGCGIAPEHIPRIFERFYRVDKARSRKLGGTGLGLAIVKHVAQLHGGRVEVESAVGEGSTFRIVLPDPDSNPNTKSPSR